MNGNLTITIVDAKELNKEDHLTKNDPYCKVSLGGGLKGLLHGEGTKQHYKTKTHGSGGANPVWNESHTFNLNGLKSDTKLRVAVYDKDLIKDDSIGVAKIPLSELFANQSKGKHYYQLVEKHHSRRIAGYVGIIAQFDGAGIGGAETKTAPTLMDKVKDKLTGHDHPTTTHGQAPVTHATHATHDPYAKGAPVQGHPVQQGTPLYVQGDHMGTQAPTHPYAH